jgi:hypothetical protein
LYAEHQKIVYPWLGNTLRCREVRTNGNTCVEDILGWAAEGNINLEASYVKEEISRESRGACTVSCSSIPKMHMEFGGKGKNLAVSLKWR